MNTTPNQAIILAAGTSSRFIPFSANSHKCHYLIMGKSIIQRTIESLRNAGISDIIVVSSPTDAHIEKILDDDITLVRQTKQLGQANAILSAIDKIEDRCLVINPQQINVDQHLNALANSDLASSISKDTIVLFSQSTDNPQKYGMLGLDGTKVTSLVEKPTDTSKLSDQRVVGIWLLTRKFINYLNSTPNEEYQLERDMNQYCQSNHTLAFETDIDTVSLKFAWDTKAVIKMILDKTSKNIHPNAHVHPSVIFNSDQIIIEDGAKIYEHAIIDGPCYIGKNAIVGRYCEVGPYTVLEEEAQIQRRVEIKRSQMGKDSHAHSGLIADSIIGDNVRIGANFITANRRLDRKTVRVKIKDKLVDTMSTYMGVLIGNNAKIGIHVGTNPGRIIGDETVVLPGTML